jgi:cysteine desulfurase
MTHPIKPSKKPIYLDYAATTPVRPEVLKAMAPFWHDKFGNPSALYKAGLEARQAVDTARKEVASVLSCRDSEVIFTAGGSESINLAILGAARAYRKKHPKGGHLITSTIEHHAVLHTTDALKADGFTVTKISVDQTGLFTAADVKKAIRPDTFLVSLMYANNEIGTIEPIQEIGNIIRAENAKRAGSLSTFNFQLSTRILFHTDACQAAGYLTVDVNKLHVDLLTINGSKIYGPKQTGCLYVKKDTPLEPIIYGGGQEKSLRSGTENVPGIVGFAHALRLAHEERAAETKRIVKLRDYFISGILKQVSRSQLNGPSISQKRNSDMLARLPNNVHISFADVDSEALMLYLDAKNIAAATGSACTSESTEPSHVLEAIGLSQSHIRGSIRFTLGKYTTKAELDYVLKILPPLITQQRNMQSAIRTEWRLDAG